MSVSSSSCPARRKLPFFPDLHHEISRSWKQPFSSRLTNAAATDFTNLVGSVEQGYDQGKRRRLSSSTSQSPALAYTAACLTPSSISSGLQKCSQLRLSSSCHVVHSNQPLPLPLPLPLASSSREQAASSGRS